MERTGSVVGAAQGIQANLQEEADRSWRPSWRRTSCVVVGGESRLILSGRRRTDGK